MPIDLSGDNDMSKFALVVGSFTLGAIFGAMSSGHIGAASASAQLPELPAPQQQGPLQQSFTSDLAPRVPPLKHNRLIQVHIGNGFVTPLDGLECESCTFDNPVLEYGGGAFDLKDTTFKGQVTIQYTGAAANTIALIGYMNGISAPRPSAAVNPKVTPKPLPPKPLPPKPPRNKPFRHSVTVTGTVKDSVSSVFGQQ